MTETVVVVPGLYTPRVLMTPIVRRLRTHGFSALTLRNRSLMKTPAQNAQVLLQQIRNLDTDSLHLLGHSLGGIVIMHLLQQNNALPADQQIPPGRVVLMAAPVRGSQIAKTMHANRFLRPLLGKSVHEGLIGAVPKELYGSDAGVLSGSAGKGFSALFYQLAGTNDGVVSESETELDGATDSVSVPHSHALMLFSVESTNLAATFFRHGRFVAE